MGWAALVSFVERGGFDSLYFIFLHLVLPSHLSLSLPLLMDLLLFITPSSSSSAALSLALAAACPLHVSGSPSATTGWAQGHHRSRMLKERGKGGRQPAWAESREMMAVIGGGVRDYAIGGGTGSSSHAIPLKQESA